MGYRTQNHFDDYRARQLKRLPWRHRYNWWGVASFIGTVAIALVWAITPWLSR